MIVVLGTGGVDGGGDLVGDAVSCATKREAELDRLFCTPRGRAPMSDTTHTAPPAGAHDDSRSQHASGLLDAIDELNRGLNLMAALQMAVETVDGSERNGLAERVSVAQRVVAGREVVSRRWWKFEGGVISG